MGRAAALSGSVGLALLAGCHLVLDFDDFSVASSTDAGASDGGRGMDASPEDGCVATGDEVCNGEDDDCDGTADEGFDLDADPAHCGTCGHACSVGYGCTEGICGDDVRAISAGGDHTCVVNAVGEVRCWGANGEGQLGTGNEADRAQPTRVMGLDAAPTSISAGGAHTCAVAGIGTWCWGANASSQLGDGTIAQRSEPVLATGGDSARQVSAGALHTCLVGTNGVRCAGEVDGGRLGLGEAAEDAVSFMAVGLAGATQVSAGGAHTCAVLGGGVRCWGVNDRGQLGDGSRTSSDTPVAVDLTQVRSLASGGGHTCAVRTNGELWCWGANGVGQLGLGDRDERLAPARLEIDGEVAEVALGEEHTCALLEEGTVQCWGSDARGQLGDGPDAENREAPVPVVDLEDIRGIAAGEAHTCAFDVLGRVWCWGEDDRGQLGRGAPMGERAIPTEVDFP